MDKKRSAQNLIELFAAVFCLLVLFFVNAVKVSDLRSFEIEAIKDLPYANTSIFVLASLLFLFVFSGICKLIRLRPFIDFIDNPDSVFRNIVHYILLLGFLALGIFFRFQYADSVSGTKELALKISELFDGKDIYVYKTGSYFYYCFVSFIYRFVGVKDNVFLYVNIFAELFGAGFIYLAIRKLIGKFYALGSFAVLMSLSGVYSLIGNCDYHSLMFFVSAFVLWLFSIFTDIRFKKNSLKNVFSLAYIFIGAISGCLLYIDVFYGCIIVFMLIMTIIKTPVIPFAQKAETPDDEEIEYPEGIEDENEVKVYAISKALLPTLILIVFAAIGFFSMYLTDFYYYGWDFSDVLNKLDYINVFKFDSFDSFRFFEITDYCEEACFLIFVALFGCYYKTEDGYKSLGAVSFVTALLIIAYSFLDSFVLGNYFTYSFFGVLIAVGVSKLFFIDPDEEDIYSEDIDPVFDNLEKRCREQEAGDTVICSEDTGKAFEASLLKAPSKIENVIPLPKKHVKKSLEFSMEPSDKDMHFDVTVSDGDDFDI